MSTLDHVNSQISQIEARVTELTDRKQRLLMQSADLFSEDSASATTEITLCDVKLAQAPKQLAALKAQRDLLELDDLQTALQPVYDELSAEYDRLKLFHKWLYVQESLLKYAKSQKLELSNQKLPTIRTKLYNLFKAMRERGLSQDNENTLKALEPVNAGFTGGLSGTEKMELEAHAKKLFHEAWGKTTEPAYVLPAIPRELLPEGFYPELKFVTPDVGQWNYEQNQLALQEARTEGKQRIANLESRFQ